MKQRVASLCVTLFAVPFYISTFCVGQVGGQQTTTQTDERSKAANLVAADLESITFKPIGENGQHISVTFRPSELARKEKVLPKAITVGFNGQPIVFNSNGHGGYVATGRVEKPLKAAKAYTLQKGEVMESKNPRVVDEWKISCGCKTVKCEPGCRGPIFGGPCLICFECSCEIKWEISGGKTS